MSWFAPRHKRVISEFNQKWRLRCFVRKLIYKNWKDELKDRTRPGPKS